MRPPRFFRPEAIPGRREGIEYFAYGSNMASAVMAQRCPGHRYVGPARLEGYRLGFTRRSVVSNSGVADLVESRGMTVWGALYQISSRGLGALGEKEGEGRGAYRRVQVEVRTEDDRLHTAWTFVVERPNAVEIVPSRSYLEGLVDGGRECGLPTHYTTFLSSLHFAFQNYQREREHYERERPDGEPSNKRELSEPDFRSGLTVFATQTRTEARGIGLLKVETERGKALGLRKYVDTQYAAVRYHGRVALAQVCLVDQDIEPDDCLLDQSIRHALGIPGSESYGAKVRVAQVSGRPKSRFLMIRPRTLSLPVRAPTWMDSEAQTAVLHEKTMRLLGLNEGESVRIYAVIDENNVPAEEETGEYNPRYKLTNITRRVTAGTADAIRRQGEEVSYPRVDEVYLDHDGRQSLGIAEEHPVLVQANIAHIFWTRLFLYGVTAFLGFAALKEIVPDLHGYQILTISILLTFGLVLLDINSRLHY
jgi:gamma-glutamylcyclotransferase (GGCT)/AIG2-like uncharacterized protein YtfP